MAATLDKGNTLRDGIEVVDAALSSNGVWTVLAQQAKDEGRPWLTCIAHHDGDGWLTVCEATYATLVDAATAYARLTAE